MAAPKIALVPPDDHPRAVERYPDGWRAGKPVEDPEKLKRWGWIAAKPSEYLVTTRRGEIDDARSGQGVRVFKWPWDSVAIVPTTLQRIEFVADQITREHVGVEITGVAVYRIAEPELAFRVLNFTYGEAASEKLAATLREMFVGAARRLVANLSLEECLTRRKETIARFLIEEIAPVVGGQGAPSDTTARGWGVVLDTIEIQQVTIQSAQVFAHLQAPYRAEIAARAELAELERKRQVGDRRADTDRRAIELARDRALHELAVAEEQRRARAAAEVESLGADAARAEAQQRANVLAVEHERALAWQRQTADLELQRANTEVAHDLRRREAETREAESQLEAAAQRRMAEIEQLVAETRARRELIAALPQIASALGHRADTLHVTQVGGDGPLAAVPQALAQLIALAHGLGIELPRRGQ